MRRALWGLLLLAACGDNLPGGAEAIDGSRLQLTWFTFEDGQTLHQSKDTFDVFLTDTQLGFACRPEELADGKIYCMPPTDLVGYLDAACTQIADRGGTADFALDTAWSCGDWHGTTLYKRTGAPTVQPYWIKDSAGNCNEQAPGPMAPISATTGLAELAIQRGEGDRVQVETLTSSDGLAVATDLYDPMLDGPCYLTPLDNTATATCTPQVYDYDETFADGTCTRKGVGGHRGCEPPHVAAIDDGGTCPSFYEVGAQLSSLAYTSTGGTCAPSMFDDATFATGAKVELATLVRAPDTSDHHRIQPIFIHEAGSAARLPDPDNFYDTELATECVMNVRSDGTAVCVPYSYAYTWDFFSDASCTQPRRLIETFDGHGGCVTRTPWQFASDESLPADPEKSGVRAIGARVTTPVYAMDSSGVCSLATGEVFELGPPVEDRQMAHATIRNPIATARSARMTSRDR